MVLDFGLINSGLFSDSSGLGVGIGTNVEQAGIVQSYNGQLNIVTGTTDISHSTSTFADIADMTFTITQDGLYLVLFSIAVQSGTSGNNPTLSELQLLKNAVVIGGGVIGVDLGVTVASSTCQGNVVIPTLSNLVVGDVVKAQWKSNGTVGNSVATFPERYHRKLILTRLWSA